VLSAEVYQSYPFSELPRLGDAIEERIQESLFGLLEPQLKPWLLSLGAGLQRFQGNDESETNRVRATAQRLTKSAWQSVSDLHSVPFVDGVPAGTARQVEVLWKDDFLFVEDRSAAKIATSVSAELGRVFDKREISDAIKLCYDRTQEFIDEYLTVNFDLAPLDESEVKPEPRPTPGKDIGADDADYNETPIADNGLDGDEIEDAEFYADLPNKDEEDYDSKKQSGPNGTNQPNRRPVQPTLIEKFALSKGFSKTAGENFLHQDGSRLIRNRDSAFSWELHHAKGHLIQAYWAKNVCIEQTPVQLDAEIWTLCEEDPDRHSLLLVDIHEDPVEMSGTQLIKFRESGAITLHAATYRIVYEPGIRKLNH